MVEGSIGKGSVMGQGGSQEGMEAARKMVSFFAPWPLYVSMKGFVEGCKEAGEGPQTISRLCMEAVAGYMAANGSALGSAVAADPDGEGD